jgi:nucleoside-diphosphate-sugar epimerase
MIRAILGWEPSTPLRAGLAQTFAWIERQYALRQAGAKVVL